MSKKSIKDCGPYSCPLELTAGFISRKWKCLIIWHLKEGKLRYSQLKRKIPDITEKMLAEVLRCLEKDDIISRKVYKTIPPKVEYELTVNGRLFIPVLESMNSCGIFYENKRKTSI